MLSATGGVTHLLSRRNRLRQRLMRLYVFAGIVNLVIGVSQSFALGAAAMFGLYVCVIITIGCLVGFLSTYYSWHQVMVARINLYLVAVLLFAEIYYSGGLAGYAAPVLVLLPLLCAFVLNTRDTIMYTVVCMLGVGILFFSNETIPTYEVDASKFFIGSGLTIFLVFAAAGFFALMLARDGEAAETKLKRLVELQTHFALHDSLTGLSNRAAVSGFFETLDAEHDRVDVFVIDLDGFKQINDEFGHAAGDKVLSAVANRLTKVLSSARMIARLGGDEFLVAVDVPACALPGFLSVGERIVDTINFTESDDKKAVKLTASVGSARFPTDSTVATELLSKADAAMYLAKEAGKCRYMRYLPEPISDDIAETSQATA